MVGVPANQFASKIANGAVTPRRSSRDRKIWRPRESRLLTVPTGQCSSRAASSCDLPSDGRARSGPGTCPGVDLTPRGARVSGRTGTLRPVTDPQTHQASVPGRAISRGVGPRPMGRSIRYAAKPWSNRIADSDRTRLTHQDQERGLERVLHVVPATEDLTADPQHHRRVAIDQLTERRFTGRVLSPSVHEPSEKLGIAESRQRSGCPEPLELSSHLTGLAWDHRFSTLHTNRPTPVMRRRSGAIPDSGNNLGGSTDLEGIPAIDDGAGCDLSLLRVLPAGVQKSEPFSASLGSWTAMTDSRRKLLSVA